jgi:uncharacterized surface protein with fasciclin (FAS1) repeats
MKNIAHLFLIMGLCLLVSCNLKLQEPFDFTPEAPTLTTFKDKTAFEWLQNQKTPDTAKTLNLERFDLLLAAIDSTGLQAEFIKSGDQRTFLLLNNAAFLGTGRIVSIIGGTTSTALLRLPVLTTANKLRLTNILKYHIINAYVDQVKAVPIWGAQYEFKTLSDTPNDIITISRNERYSLTINSSPSLPATRRTFGVYRHNYQFGNGMGHIVNNYAGIVAF